MIDRVFHMSCTEICQYEGIEKEAVIDIVEYGIAKPIAGKDAMDWVFDISSVHWMKKAARLSRDLEIDWVAVALVIDLLQQRESLQRENERYQRQLQRFTEA